MGSKEKQIILNLLEVYRDMPFLWDKNHKEYYKKQCRKEGQRVLLEIYKELEPNATVQTMNKKISNLRTNYITELQKVINSAGAKATYVPTLYYFEAFSFLGEYNESCSMTRDYFNETDDQRQYLTLTSSDEETMIKNRRRMSNNSKRKKTKITKAKILKKQDDLMTAAGELMNYKDKEEDWIILGKSIGLQLRDLDEKTLTITQKIISDAIYYAKIGLLTQNSSIELGPPVSP